MRQLALMACVLVLTACVSTPKPLQGTFAELTPAAAAKKNALGGSVRWGGRIVAVDNRADHTCFKILSVRLDASGRPRNEDQTDGRFIACRAGFYDPAIFKKERDITITGRIEALRNGRIGAMTYAYPQLSAEVIYLWPERREVQVIVERSPFWW